MKKVVIVGAGALGSHLVLLLRNLPAEFKIIDFDRVETKNTKSQFHTRSGVGRLKVDALAMTMHLFFGTKPKTVSNKLADNNTNQLLGGADLIVDCVDNVEARKLIQDYARRNNIDCVHGGLAPGGAYGIVIWDEHFQVATAENTTAAEETCENGEFLPHIVAVSAYLAEAVKQFITDGKKRGYSISPAHMSRV